MSKHKNKTSIWTGSVDDLVHCLEKR